MIRLGLGLGLGLTQQGIKALPPEPVIDGAMVLNIDTNLASGTTVELPLSGTVDCTVYWGDWSTPTAATEAGYVSHTYARPGTYTIQIDGDLTSFGDGATWTGADMLTSVTTFGTTGCVAFPGAFYGASNLTVLPDSVTGVTDISNMLNGATSYNGTELSTWDITSLTDAANALDGCGLEPDHYNQIIMSWADQVATNSDLPASITLGADGLWWGNAEYSGYTHADTDTARNYLTTTAGWTIDGDTEAFSMTLDMTKITGTTVAVPFSNADMMIYWGDGESEHVVLGPVYNADCDVYHTYPDNAAYSFMATGSISLFGRRANGWYGDRWTIGHDAITEMRSFGNVGLSTIFSPFMHNTTLTYITGTLPATNMNIASAFAYTKLNHPNMAKWETTHDYGYFYFFTNNPNYNQPFTANCSNVQYMVYTFTNCTSFDQNLGGLLLRKAGVEMDRMLDNCGMSVENYSRTLIGWANYVWNEGVPAGPFNVTLGAAGLKYDDTVYGTGHFTDAVTAKAWLTTAGTGGAGWAITDAGEYSE